MLRDMVRACAKTRVGWMEALWSIFADVADEGAATIPACWTDHMAGPLLAAKQKCDEELGLTTAWSSELSEWALFVWADNLFLMASTTEGLHARCRAQER